MFKTILMVDTDPVTPILIEHWLLQTGTNVVCAHADTVGAMVQYMSTKPGLDLIIIEPFLQEYNGHGILTQCQEAGIFEKARVGVLSVLGKERLLDIVQHYPILFTLTKPVTKEIITFIESALSN